MDPDKCADFTLYLEKYLKALYVIDDDPVSIHGNTSAPSEPPIINNPIKSKAVGRPKKGRIRCEKEKENTPPVKKKRGRPKKNLEMVPTQKRVRNNIT